MIFLSCSTTRRFLLPITTDHQVSVQDYNDHITNGLKDWKYRHKRNRLESFIKHFEFCARSSESHTSALMAKSEVFIMLSRAYYLLANNHVSDLSESKGFWESGAYWAERSLYTNSKFERAVGEYGEYIGALKYVKKSEVGALYWYLANIGKWAKNSGIATSLKYLKLTKAFLKRIQKFDSNFYYSGTDRYWGAYYSVIPFFAGGDLKKSRYYFKRSLKKSPNYLGTKLLYAELYLKKNKMWKAYEKTLKEIVNCKLDESSEIYSENFLEKKKAEVLLTAYQSDY